MEEEVGLGRLESAGSEKEGEGSGYLRLEAGLSGARRGRNQREEGLGGVDGCRRRNRVAWKRRMEGWFGSNDGRRRCRVAEACGRSGAGVGLGGGVGSLAEGEGLAAGKDRRSRMLSESEAGRRGRLVTSGEQRKRGIGGGRGLRFASGEEKLREGARSLTTPTGARSRRDFRDSTRINQISGSRRSMDARCPGFRQDLRDSMITSFSVSFYILLRAVDRFTANYNRFPGLFDNEMEEDISRLKTIAVGVLSDSGLHGSTLAEDLINEMCRFGGAEIHPVAAFIGGVASQEAIKLITKQFVPLNGTLVFNGIDQKSQVLAV